MTFVLFLATSGPSLLAAPGFASLRMPQTARARPTSLVAQGSDYGFDEASSVGELRSQFRVLAAKVHPDSPDGGDPEEFQRLVAAYESHLTDTRVRLKDEELVDALAELASTVAATPLVLLTRTARTLSTGLSTASEAYSKAQAARATSDALKKHVQNDQEINLARIDAAWRRVEERANKLKLEHEDEERADEEALRALQARAAALLEVSTIKFPESGP